jgi:hypothetical protein
MSFHNDSLPDFVGCYNNSCENVTAGSLYAQSLVCSGTPTVISTFEFNVVCLLRDSCVNLRVSVISGHVYSETPQSPFALSFFSTNDILVRNNSYAVVKNADGVVVGQIFSDMIHFDIETYHSETNFSLNVSLCILRDVSVGEDDSELYTVFDIGVLGDDLVIRPLGLNKAIRQNNQNTTYEFICFSNVTIPSVSYSIILIQRVDDFESYSSSTQGEHGIVLTSAVLFCCGAFVVVVFHCITSLNLPIFVIGMESVALLLFRGIYFFLLNWYVFPIGGLLDFALIEIPTFIYISIFLQIIIPSYRFFFNQKMSTRSMVFLILGCVLLNWIIFAIMLIIITTATNPYEDTKTCNCQLADPVQPNTTPQIVRLVFTSICSLMAISAVIVTFLFRDQAIKAGGIETLYTQVIVLSFGLFFDCVAFVIYYAVNQPTAYFLIVLWFTELLPICMMNGVVTWTTRMINIKAFHIR